MSRYSTAQPTPPQPTVEGDQSFIGMDMTTPREKLPVGWYPAAVNKRSTSGDMETRPGTIMPAFANLAQEARSAPYPFYGSGSYSNPHGLQSRLVALRSEVLVIRDGAYPSSVPIDSRFNLGPTVEFSQQNDKILLHAGGVLQMIWDGVSAEGFVLAEKSDPANTITSTIPDDTLWSVSMADRAIIPIEMDQLAASDVLDYTTVDLSLTGLKFRSNSGTADPIVGAFPFTQNTLIIGKRDSIDRVTNFYGDLSDTRVEVVSKVVGMVSRKAVAYAGSDCIFVHDTGVYQLSQVDQSRLDASPLPVASRRDENGSVVDPIAPLLRRVNWNVANKFRTIVHGGYFYWAFAIDGADGNNAVACLNLIKNAWEGYDTWGDPAFRIDDLYVAKYLGQNRVWAIDYYTKAIYVLYEGKTDQLASGEYQVADSFETRAYATLGWNAASARESKRVEIGVRTWHPSITITQVMDGDFDEQALTATPITYDPLKYEVWGKADFVLDNRNGDWAVPGRQEYSVGDGNYFDGAGGIDVDRKQTQPPLRFSLSARGRYFSFHIANTQGQCDVTGVLFESSGNQREVRQAA